MSVEQSVASRTGWGQIKVPQWGQVRVPFPANEAREAARRRAEGLDTRLVREARAVDTASTALAEAASAYFQTYSNRQNALVAAGRAEYGRGGDPSPSILGALGHALQQAGVPGIISRRALEAAWRPLAANLE